MGSPKTGTTFLQQLLWSQREVALAQGLLLPLEGVGQHFMACLDLRDSPHLAGEPAKVRGTWAALVDAVAAHPGDVLVSHEAFAMATDEQAARALTDLATTGHEVHVVITARDLVRQWPAQWQESLKAGGRRSWPDYLDQIRTGEGAAARYLQQVEDYPALARRWSQGLSADRVHVVTVPQPGADRGLLWCRFAKVLGVEAAAFSLDQPRSNASLGYEQAELLRRVNAVLDGRLRRPGPYPAIVKGVYAHKVLAGRPGSPIVLPDDAHELARERSQQMVDDLRALGVSVAGELDELVPGVREQAEEPAPASAEELLEEALGATAGLLVEMAEARQRQRSRVAGLRERLQRAERAAADAPATPARRRRRWF